MLAHEESSYDRPEAAGILALLAYPALFPADDGATGTGSHAAGPIEFTSVPMVFEPNGQLTAAQQRYRERSMYSCPAELITSATHRIAWIDSAGGHNVGHCGPSDLGPVVPIAARETTLALWRSLAVNRRLAEAISELNEAQQAVLAATATDPRPMEIFRIGVDSTARALAQHALLADQAGCRDPASFARGMRQGGLFAAVAGQWFWGLQSGTYRRGMVPAALSCGPDGSLRYRAETVANLRRMKDAAIAHAREVMDWATGVEGLSVAEAVARYYTERDLIPKQYAMLPHGGPPPRCLAHMPQVIGGRKYSVLPDVVDAFVEVFCQNVARIVTVQRQDEDLGGAARAA